MIPAENLAGMALLEDHLLTSGVMTRRVIAWLLDALLIVFVCASFWTFAFMFGVLTLGLGWPMFGALPAIPILYHWLFLASPMAATPGQAMLGLTVRRNDDLGRPTPLQALVSVAIFYLTLALGVIWLAFALFTVRHRAIHDFLSGLVVIRARALTRPVGFWNMPPGGSPAA